MHTISIYDMDKTITRKATFGPFLVYAAPRYRPWRLISVPLVVLATAAFGLRLVNRARLKEINLGLMLGHRINCGDLQRLSLGFAGRTLATNTLTRAMDRIAADRAEGRRIVLATASYDFYVEEVAKLIGVSDVIATRATRDGGVTRPAIDGENCYGQAKLNMVEAWLSGQGIARGDAHIRFYSDHVSDAPCLSWADEAFATNPHAPLRALAASKGWEVFDWG
jgi:HAD superfamily hydrolase (TIGR01490 family)